MYIDVSPRLAVMAVLSTTWLAAWAQPVPNAGSLLQQIERPQEQQILPGRTQPQLTTPPPEMKVTPGPSVTVREFRFQGNTLLSANELAPAVQDYLNRPLDFAGLNQAAAAVAETYRRAGWIVRVYLPHQEISDGIVTLQIVEAVFGKVRVESKEIRALSPERARAWVEAAQQPGEYLSGDHLDRALLLLNDLPGVEAIGALVPGSEQSATDLLLGLSDKPFVHGMVGLENTGPKSTGNFVAIGSAYLNSPLLIGDQIAAYTSLSEGSQYLRLAYNLPVGYSGWRVGINGSALHYKIIQNEFKALDGNGGALTWGLDARYPIIRARNGNLFFAGAYDNRYFNNEAGSITTSDYATRSLSAGLLGNLFDRLGGGGTTEGSLVFTRGKVDLDGSPNRLQDAATVRTEGNYSILRYSLSRQQAVAGDLSLNAKVAGQAANTNLESSERYYIGGAYSVRAYPANQCSGSDGVLGNLELTYRLPQNFQLSGFYDWGRVRINHNNDFIGAAVHNTCTLQGPGIGLAWTGPSSLTLKATYAYPTGSNPTFTLPDTTSNGDTDKGRFWLTANLPF